MPSRTIFISSMSEVEIPHGTAWKLRLTGPNEADYFESDLTAEEAAKLVKESKAEQRAKRGRKAASK